MPRTAWAAVLLAALPATLRADPPKFASHPPMRPLPAPSDRPAPTGPAFHVDPKAGDDANHGSAAKPWKTVAHAVRKLQPGDTLLLRGGVYYEMVTVSGVGTPDKPITLRSFPGELAVIDGGLREFAETPAAAWEPVPNSPGEFRSAKPYLKLNPVTLGHVLDSMTTLHGYKNRNDLISTNPYFGPFRGGEKLADEPPGLSCGPGLWYDAKSGHVHCRLAHTTFDHIGAANNYRGETDPRKVPLSVAGAGVPLTLDGAKHVRVQDIVVRGGSKATLSVENCDGVELDGLFVYGGSPAVQFRTTRNLKLINSCVRGVSAPWSWRGGHKYRGNAAYLLVARPEQGGCRDVEIAHCELTDCHDGPYLGTVRNLRLHHCLIDNFNDDGVYLTGAGVGGNVHIYQNRFSRCLHCFAFAGKYPLGPGVYVFRNVFDLRGEVRYQWPDDAKDARFQPEKPGGPVPVPHTGWLCGDHGSPTWEKIFFYHNTVVFRDKAFRDGYGDGLNRGTGGTTRRVFNNVFVQTEGLPGQVIAPPGDDFVADHNLFWSASDGPKQTGDYFAAVRNGKAFAASKASYPPGWGANDRFADPRFVKWADYGDPAGDFRIGKDSPAVGTGMRLPADWPDVVKSVEKPDVGAFLVGAGPLTVGPGRKSP